ncbi:hypothetical protein [Roseicitreum antarcticum]|uniref:Uncharacterized protein n=1 Tax=Roseicitreum antarcticum TaxID=564137 RepID=A0A1H2RR07_9RHOB|nr:hypothetical protein [Roseicitreum antarcticum]SDW21953.1 hypothetical protein SAMN04488238_101398 [Roseicitreum antarcticum]
MKTLPIIALLLSISAPAYAQNAPAGAEAMACDTSEFTAVRSDETGEILYWNNSTCETPTDDGNMMGMMPMQPGGMGGMGGMDDS